MRAGLVDYTGHVLRVSVRDIILLLGSQFGQLYVRCINHKINLPMCFIEVVHQSFFVLKFFPQVLQVSGLSPVYSALSTWAVSMWYSW